MYSQEITRRHRAAIVIAIDQSSSMSGRMRLNGNDLSKAEAVSMVTGHLIDELIMRSFRDNSYRYYYDIAILGYSGTEVYSLIGDTIEFYPITMLATRKVQRTPYKLSYTTLNSGVNSFYEEVSMWAPPRAEGATPMYKMVNVVTELVASWCAKEENRDSFPPLVFNVTDGEISDGNYEKLRSAASRLKDTGTLDGKTLFVNTHITSNTSHEPIVFPNVNEVPISIHYAHLLMDISSVMPEQFHSYIEMCRPGHIRPPYIAMSYNSSISELVAMLNIGSRSLMLGL